MGELSEKAIEEYREIFKREYGKELSDKEAREGAQNLLSLAELLLNLAQEDFSRKQRLKKERKGFHLEEGKIYNCLICHSTISGKDSWWDLGGPKCLICQKAVDTKVIPKMLGKKRDSWYASWELKDKFGIHHASIKKLVREGKLRSRTILYEDGRTHFQVFLKKENPILK